MSSIVAALYCELNERLSDHDFGHVGYDAYNGMLGLHKVRFVEQKPAVSPDLFAKYAAASFSVKSELNTQGVRFVAN